MCDPATLAMLAGSGVVGAAGTVLNNQTTAKNNRDSAIAASVQNQENTDYNLADQARWGDYQTKLSAAQLKQMTEDTAAANAENAVRDKAIASYGTDQGANDKSIGGLIAKFSAPEQGAAQGANAATRTAAIQGNMAAPAPITKAETGTGGSPAISQAFTNAAGAGSTASHAQGAAAGNYGAYGDTWMGNDAAIAKTDSDIKATNSNSAVTKQLLPGQQQIAGFKQEAPIDIPMPTEAIAPPAPVYQAPDHTSAWGTALTGLGQLGGAVAGSGKAPGLVAGAQSGLSGLGSLFSSTAPSFTQGFKVGGV